MAPRVIRCEGDPFAHFTGQRGLESVVSGIHAVLPVSQAAETRVDYTRGGRWRHAGARIGNRTRVSQFPADNSVNVLSPKELMAERAHPVDFQNR